MVQLAEALHGELPGPPVKALFVYNSNPAAVCPDQARVLSGLAREDLFTVVHEQFQTDTADYADIVLPATTQLEHFDIHGSYGHLYVQANNPAIAPLGEAKPNTEVFRLLARAMGFEPELFEVSDEELAAEVVGEPGASATGGGAPSTFDGITLDDDQGRPRAAQSAPRTRPRSPRAGSRRRRASANSTPSARPAPAATRCRTTPRRTRTRRRSRNWRRSTRCRCSRPPAPAFLNSTFVNVDVLRKGGRRADGRDPPRPTPRRAASPTARG